MNHWKQETGAYWTNTVIEKLTWWTLLWVMISAWSPPWDIPRSPESNCSVWPPASGPLQVSGRTSLPRSSSLSPSRSPPPGRDWLWPARRTWTWRAPPRPAQCGGSAGPVWQTLREKPECQELQDWPCAGTVLVSVPEHLHLYLHLELVSLVWVEVSDVLNRRHSDIQQDTEVIKPACEVQNNLGPSCTDVVSPLSVPSDVTPSQYQFVSSLSLWNNCFLDHLLVVDSKL